jgi:hypothetical protein
MKEGCVRDTMLLALAAFAVSAALFAQDAEPAAETAYDSDCNSITAVRINPVKDRLARIEGRVIRLLSTAPGSERAYFIQDDSGKALRVLTQGKLPGMGESLVVEGRIDFIHEPDREVVLNETGRSKIEVPAEEEPSLLPVEGTGDNEELSQTLNTTNAGGVVIPITAGALLLLAAGGAAAFYFIRQARKPALEPSVPVAVAKEAGEEIAEVLPAEQPEGEAQEQAEPTGEAPEKVFAEEEKPMVEEGKKAPLESAATADDRDEVAGEIVRTFYPLPDKVKSIPGRLELVGGENDLRELYFRLPKDTRKNFFTFGNLDSSDFGHYRINHPSVAENQAKIVFADGEFELINYSIENPTRVNSRELQDGERIALNPGDMIEMGALEMIFHTEDEEESLPELPASQAQEQAKPEEGGQPEPDHKT